MGESSKQVRVDNWGVFFLQRLQMFFNKTDYCDLTLQFEGNVQLKVHRLVMNACTEYFQILEQTCGTVGRDVLVMPPDLQSDVVVPIVNFMYTGMLEFHMSLFEKLYKTAELMNITVLTKLLEAQRQPLMAQKARRSPPSTWNTTPKKVVAKKEASTPELPAMLPGRKLPVWKRKSAPTAATQSSPHLYEMKRPVPPDPLAIYDNTPKPTRFEWPEEELTTFNLLDSNFDDISYTSKPLLTQEDEMRAGTSFDDIRQSSPQHKTPSKSYSTSGIDIDEVKDYVKEQKIRSDLTDFEDLTDGDLAVESGQPAKRRSDGELTTGGKRVRFSVSEKENKEAKINITPTGKGSGDMNHTKIISELLKKYPHLVKKNKNIRLKIMAKSSKSPESKPLQGNKTAAKSRLLRNNVEDRSKIDGPWTCHLCSTSDEPMEFVLYYLYRKHMTDTHNEKFDALMCKYCGHKCSKHNMLMYHMFTKHGIRPPPAYNFPKCNKCHYVALTEGLLIKHKLNHTKFELQCPDCKVAFNTETSLTNHMQITGHSGRSEKHSYDCQYCNKKYQSGINLFSHIKMQHRDEARRDGIVSIDEAEDEFEDLQHMDGSQIREEDRYVTPDIIQEKTKEKIKILSNVKVPKPEQREMALEPSSEAEALNNVASGIATSLGLVDIVVLNDNQQYILQTNNQIVSQDNLHTNESQFILPELTNAETYTQNRVITTEHNVITQSILNNSDIASTDDLVMVLTDHDYGDGNNELINNENSNIVVLYSHPVDGQENQFITSQSNLMVNSETGMIEIRNGATIPTDQLVMANAQDNQIESIEMIQRELNAHSNGVKSDQPPMNMVEAADVPVDNGEQYSGSLSNSDEVDAGIQDEQLNQASPPVGEYCKPEEEPMEVDMDQDEQLNQSVTDSYTQSEEQEQEEQEKSVEAEEEEGQDVQETEAENQSASSENHIQEEEEVPSHETEGEDVPPDTVAEEEHSKDPEEYAEPMEVDGRVAQPQEEEREELNEEPPDEGENEQQDTGIENHQEPIQEQDEAPSQTEDDNASVEECFDGHGENEEQGKSADDSQGFQEEGVELEAQNSQDENSQSSQVSQESEVQQQVEEGDDDLKSAKISILDDWEDTDSQQSENRGVKEAAVHKLMDDWGDEDDDDKKND